MNRLYPHLSKGYAYVEFESSDEAEKALKHMNGGGSLDTRGSLGVPWVMEYNGWVGGGVRGGAPPPEMPDLHPPPPLPPCGFRSD